MTVDELLGDTAWLRGLARSLVRDAAAAEDLVQDAAVVAAAEAPRDGRPLRPWLVRVTRNLARMTGRTATRRAAREAAVAGLAPPPSRPDELVLRLELHRLLAELVIALAPAQRDVVVLRYVDELSSAAIGERLGVPEGTVRWRLKQALDELRARLDARRPRRAWVPALAALGPASCGVPPLAALAAIIAAIVLAVGGLAWLALPSPSPSPSSPPGPPAAKWGPTPLSGYAPVIRIMGSDPILAAARYASVPMTGRLVDGAGLGVAGVPVHIAQACTYPEPDVAPVTSGVDGVFAAELAPQCSVYLDAETSDRRLARLALETGEGPIAPVRLELGPDEGATVRVLDALDGAPIAGARVAGGGQGGVTDARGELPVVSFGGVRAQLVTAPGHVAMWFELSWTEPPTGSLELRLARAPIAVSGTLRDADGAPLAGTVEACIETAGGARDCAPLGRADATGAFEGALARAGHWELTAHPTTVDGPRRPHPAWLAEGELEVNPGAVVPPLALVAEPAGHADVDVSVVDASGRPVAGAEVAVPNRDHDGFRPGFTDATGHFVIRDLGLFRLRADTADVALVATRGAEASPVTVLGDDVPAAVTLRLGSTALAGVVVDAAGRPAPDAVVMLAGDTENAGVAVTVDPQGRFQLAVRAGGAYRLSARAHIDDDDASEAVTVRAGDTAIRLVVP